jgi:hypothetical protein
MATDEQRSDAQNAFAILLWDGRGVSEDLTRGARIGVAGKRVAEAQSRYGIWLLSRRSGHRDIPGSWCRYKNH